MFTLASTPTAMLLMPVVFLKRTIAHGFVVPACRIAGERRSIKGVVAVTRGIATKCLESNGRVGAADRVVGKRARTTGRIGVAGGVENERASSIGAVVAAGRIVAERIIVSGCV